MIKGSSVLCLLSLCLSTILTFQTLKTTTSYASKDSTSHSIITLFKRGDSFFEALASDWPAKWRLSRDTLGISEPIPITTYTYDPYCDLWLEPCSFKGPQYPGEHLYIIYCVPQGTTVDSIALHIPARGMSNGEKNVKYESESDSSDSWEVIHDFNGLDYYGYDWTIFCESRNGDGLWPVDSRIFTDDAEYLDTSYIILDSQFPFYEITYLLIDAPRDSLLPTIRHPHPYWGNIPVTKKQLIDVHIRFDQTVASDLPGNGRLWSYVEVFIFAPGDKVDIEGIPACIPNLSPCGPGEQHDRWVNEPPLEDTLDYYCTWNVEHADHSSEGMAIAMLKCRDTAGNIFDLGNGMAGFPTFDILIDITAPSSPDIDKISICADGRVITDSGAVGQDWWGNPLKVKIYNDSSLSNIFAEFWANSNGSFNTIFYPPPTIDSEIFLTALDHAGNESAPLAAHVIACDCENIGDVDGDENINSLDVMFVVNHMIGLTPIIDSQSLCRADFNNDGRIDVLDIIGIVNLILEGGKYNQ